MQKWVSVLGSVLLAVFVSAWSQVYAGILGRSGQSVSPLFENGQLFEYHQQLIRPEVTGTDSLGQPTGNVSKEYTLWGIAYKTDLSEAYSVAFIVDQPWGADFSYAITSPLYGGTQATADSTALTSLFQSRLESGLRLYGGLRYQSFSGELVLNGLAFGPLAGYTMKSEKDWSLGYVLGLGYDNPAYGAQVSFTYSSEIEHNISTEESISPGSSTTKVTTPQSVNIGGRIGIAAKTLLFGSIRWVNWRNFEFQPENLGFPVADFNEDIVTYVAGLGRQLSSQWSAAITLRHEARQGSSNSLFRPTNGYHGIVIGATYTTQGKTKISSGLSYTRTGNATAKTAGGNAVRFSDNDSVALGIKLQLSF